MDSFNHKQYDKFAEFDAKDFEFLYSSASKLIEIDSKNDLFHFVADVLNKYANSIVLANEYDPENREMLLYATSGIQSHIDIVIDVIGGSLKGFKNQIDDKRVEILIKNQFIEIEGGLYNLVERTIPKNVCTFLEKLFDIKHIYLMAFLEKDNLLGNIVLLTKKPVNSNQINTIQYFLYTASIALQKVKKDEELLYSKKMLELRVEERTKELQILLNKIKEENDQHRQTERALEKTRDDLAKSLVKEKELNELKTKFISTVSHEYRTPLTVIQTSTYILEKYFETGDEENFKRQLSKVKSAIKYMTELLEDILTFGRSTSQKLTTFIQKFDIIAFIDEIIEEFKLIDKGKHKILFNRPEEKLLIQSDMKYINYILGNLIQNGIKYSDEGTTIELSVFDNFDFVEFQIIDKGMGIPEQELEYLFDPFYRGSKAENIPGTGLGLSIAQRYTEELGGTISVESKVNEGSRFMVSLPKVTYNQ